MAETNESRTGAQKMFGSYWERTEANRKTDLAWRGEGGGGGGGGSEGSGGGGQEEEQGTEQEQEPE